MEPGTSLPGPSPEMGAYRASEAAAAPGSSSELPPAVEKQPVKIEAGGAPQGGSPGFVAALPPLSTLPPPQNSVATALPAQPTDSTPQVASDEDLVEKEWVDKAKKIVTQTKDDPFAQEKEVSKLQADYLKKRYGKEVKLNSE